MKTTCEICAFRNPKATVTAIIKHGNTLLLSKRAKNPHRGKWEFVGGFMQENEMPEEALKRELKEELNFKPQSFHYLGAFPGSYIWKKKRVPVIGITYLVKIKNKHMIKMGNEESTGLAWFSRQELPKTLPLPDNNKALHYVKKRGLI